jgi:hypothetical protein
VVAELGVADAVFTGVAHDASPAQVGHGDPQFRAAPPDLLVELLERDARLDDRVAAGLANDSYSLLPWRLGLLTQTNSTC